MNPECCIYVLIQCISLIILITSLIALIFIFQRMIRQWNQFRYTWILMINKNQIWIDPCCVECVPRQTVLSCLSCKIWNESKSMHFVEWLLRNEIHISCVHWTYNCDNKHAHKRRSDVWRRSHILVRIFQWQLNAWKRK